MNRPLNQCVITGPSRNPATHFAATAFSLFYQASTLGIKMEHPLDETATGRFAFTFRTPVTTPVTCDITAWGHDTESAQASENIIQAACGMMSVHGRAGGKIQPLGLHYVSTLTAAMALQGAVAAALGQLRGLTVANTRISMASAALLGASQYIADATVSAASENLPAVKKSECPAPPFISSDGVVFELETLNADSWLKFWTRLEVNPVLAGTGWTAFLLRYAKASAPVPDELSHTLTQISYRDIAALCAQTGMSICTLYTLHERVADQRFKDEWLNGPWAFGLNTDAAHAQAKPLSCSLPLSGLTVVESCRRIQGPLAGHLLALLGAEVIRIEPPGGDPLRGMPPIADGCSVRFDALNRLKTVREIDIKSASGQSEVMALVREADVFLHNWAPHKAAQLTLDDGDLAGLNPALIYAYAAGWSTQDGDARTPSDPIPGTDFMVQAYSGVAHKISQACGSRGGSLFTLLDVLGGVIAAQGITVALLNRFMNRRGGKVTSSLLSAATLLCSEDFQRQYNSFDTQVPPACVLSEVYETKQGKIAVDCCNEEMVQRLLRLLDEPTDCAPPDVHQRLQTVFLTQNASRWLSLLQQAGIPAVAVAEDLSDLPRNAQLQSFLHRGTYLQVVSPWSFQ
ncbi:MAG: CoA transferase [Nitrosomonas sp.]|nr:MAG: CoA transferase [Nitrosomonas sp.]